MSRGVGSLLSKHRAGAMVLALMAVLLIVPASAAACGEEGTEDTAPLINWAKTTPATVSFEGGTGVVEVEVEDDCGVQQVYAEIYGPEGFFFTVFQLLPSKIVSTYASVYRGEFQIVPNHQESSVYYGVNISVLDTNGAPANTFAGEIEVEAAPPFDEAPYVSEASLTPPIVGSGGGGVKISANASDNRGLASVFAVVIYPDETQHDLYLEGVSSSHFQGRFIAPPNNGAEFAQYSVIVYAEDDIGQRSFEKAGSFKVAPKTGKLNAWTNAGSYFGFVPLGETAVRKVVVRNSGGPKTSPVAASIGTSGSPFAVKGASGGNVQFTLGPEEMRVFEVEFQPATPGYKADAAIVSRPDGAQPDIAVQLSGQGAKPPDG